MLFAIAALYNNVMYQVKFTNGLSEAFGGDTGVRQGCPLSPFLFGIFVEMLHERIRAQHLLRGLASTTATRCMCHYCSLLMMLH
jgi:hypothetical protein